MKAIILADRKCGVLDDFTENRPKCLFLAGSSTILEYQLSKLEGVGIRDIVLVLGHEKNLILNLLKSFSNLNFTIIENPNFTQTGSAYSLWLARKEMNDDFICLKDELIFHKEILNRIISNPNPNNFAVVRKSRDEEATKVRLEGKNIIAIRKQLASTKVYGDFIGIAKFSGEVAKDFVTSLNYLIEKKNFVQAYYELSLELLIKKKIDLTAVDITDLPFLNVKSTKDLANFSENEYQATSQKCFLPQKNKKILFYIQRNLHLPFLEPIFDYMNTNYDFDLYISSPKFICAEGGSIGIGLEEKEIQKLSEKANFISDLSNFRPDATIIADIGGCYPLKYTGKIVNVGHGLISKGWFYVDSPVVRRENYLDLTCVPGPWHKEILSKNLFHPIEVTGFVKSDKVFGVDRPSQQEVKELFNIPEDKKVVLYAPTFNLELSSIPCLLDKVTEVIDENSVLLIKLHGMTTIEYVEMYKKITEENESVIFVDDIDLASAMIAADIMISDVSSAFVEFLLLNKPVIIYRNPKEVEYPGYNPNDIEYQVREATIVVDNLEQLKLAVRLSLLNPLENEAKRLKWIELLDYGCDGKVVQRIAKSINDLLTTDKYKKQDLNFSIICIWQEIPNDKQIEDFLQKLGEKNSGHNLEVLMTAPEFFNNQESKYNHLWLKKSITNIESFEEVVSYLKGDYVIITQSDVVYPNNWLENMSYYFRWFENSGAVMAFSQYDDYKFVLEKSVPDSDLTKFEDIAEVFGKLLIGNDVKVPNLYDFCYMFDRRKIKQINNLSSPQGSETIAGYISEKLKTAGYDVRFALDVFVYKEES